MNRNLTKTVIITGITTNNPDFQWYKIGQKFNVVKSVKADKITGEIDLRNDYYRVVDESGDGATSVYNPFFYYYIHPSDCKEITEFRNSRLEQLGI